MLDNAQAAILPQAAESGTVVKRYAPPNQRNRSANRRKSSDVDWLLLDRLDRANSAGNDSEKNQNALPRNAHVPDQGDIGCYSLVNENHYSRFIALEGCSCSAASQLLNDRWSAAIQSYNNAKDSSEKPEMYSGATSSVWTQFRLPHQIMSPGPSSFGSQLDFLGELRRQMHRANPNPGFSP
ncbi:uncharacterized protein LOC107609127 isoform X1 [Arachis ipaensis]|uniref:uncharacterized protein LOC107609127 isoform X1 n=1 Tax=Arachis ipaensis TaxID=130454 RepID=UPI000A2B46FB|nr:uncharacterized protein LOC107609127 isoform X1 [Arachis ipaensis]XP_025666735.1 uncharacterized protein LOC112765085 isoform X1 [Arachis hypogaea]